MGEVITGTAFWEKGIYLSKAPNFLAPKSFRDEWEALEKRSSLAEANTALKTMKGKKSDVVEMLNTISSAMSTVTKPKTELQNKMRGFVINWLIQGDLIAFGFEKPRRLVSIPQQLKPELWHGDINWHGNSLKSQGLEIIEIRILSRKNVESHKTTQIDKNITVEAVTEPILGRPTIRPQIIAAFQYVLNSGKLSEGMSLKTISKYVRIQLAHANPDLEVTENKPNYETIRRVISPLWKDHNKQ